MPSYYSVTIDVDNNPRPGAPTRTPLRIEAQSITATLSWGATPGTASITYVSTEQIAEEPITVGDGITVTVGPHTFYGVCKLDTAKIGSSGNTRVLEFADYREFLDWDVVYCAFNMPFFQLINGQRIKRYWHVYPDDYVSGKRTYTDQPYLAYEIANYLFNAATVAIDWTAIYNDVLDTPVYALDYMGGQPLGAALADISSRLGAVFTHWPFGGIIERLVWLRKGYGSIPAFPDNSDDRRIGSALSGFPSRVRLVGDRNLYQVLNVAMEKDWASAWEAFVDFSTFAEDVYIRGEYNALPDDPEGFVGWQEAYARARVMTVREYVALSGSTLFADKRKFNGHSRMDMPVALYIQNVLFRAFRPPVAFFYNVYGAAVDMTNAEIVPRNLAQLSHDVSSGEISLLASTLTPGDGTGYAIAKGYVVGRDLFATLNPHQFDITKWNDAQTLWQHVPFQVDDSGEGYQFITFDQPVINAAALLLEVDGHLVVKANPEITTPAVHAALTFAAERYFYPPNATGYLGSGSKDGVENVSGLNGEFIVEGDSFLSEVRYPDAISVDDKASEIATTLLSRQPIYYEGGFRVQGLAGYQLSSIIDRITIHNGPDAFYEQVDFTNERARNYFEPERSLDRATVQNSQFSGQAELRQQARQAQLIGKTLRIPRFRENIQDILNGRIGNTESLRTVSVLNGDVTVLYPAGTPFFRNPINVSTTPNSDTLVLPP